MSGNVDGVVYLVGAGPGRADSITLRARDVLARADEVLYDYLVNPAVLAHVRDDAECICLGRHGRSSLWKPSEIHARMVESAQQGKRVVRLKSGDPMVFGRAAGELAALVANNVPFEIVPGITAAMAVPSFAGVPITDRDNASAVAFVTGQEDPSKPDSRLDYSVLARFPGTLVFYMGVTRAAEWTSQLMAHGAAPDQAVALVRRCGWPNQQVLHCRLDEVVERVTPYSKFPPPVLAIVGPVAARPQSAQFDWFSQRPLFGHSVMVIRPAHQADSLIRPLSDLGADVIAQPVVDVRPVDFGEEEWGRRFSEKQIDVVIFSSANGVEHFIGRLWRRGADLRLFADSRLITVGPATDLALAQYHLRGDAMPSGGRFDSEAIVQLFRDEGQSEQRVLIVRGETGRNVLAPELRGLGHQVEELVVYRTEPVKTPEPEVSERLEQVQWVLASSAALGLQAVRMLGEHAKTCRWIAISQRTSEALQEAGVEVAGVAERSTMESLIEALVKAASAS